MVTGDSKRTPREYGHAVTRKSTSQQYQTLQNGGNCAVSMEKMVPTIGQGNIFDKAQK